jgi:hypothetical protein
MYKVGLGITNPVAMRFRSNSQNESGAGSINQNCPLKNEKPENPQPSLKEPLKEDVYTPQQEEKPEEAKPLGLVEKGKTEKTENKQQNETSPHYAVKEGGAGKPEKSTTGELQKQPVINCVV